MTESPPTALPEVLAGATSLFAAPVLRELRRMNLGHLTLVLPDGSAEEIASPTSDARFTATIVIRDPEFYRAVALFGDIGFAEAYIAGHWTTPDLQGAIAWAIHNATRTATQRRSQNPFAPVNLLRRWNRLLHHLRPNTPTNSQKNISEHYDLGNEFYKLWLDKTMTYSAARYDTGAESLEAAQTAKYEALCQQLKLKSSDHVLEIGCGWGGFAEHAVKHHGCKVTGLTISKEQLTFANKRFAEAGIADSATAIFEDYRAHQGSYDKIVSIEMLEAVGDNFLETYFKKAASLLKPDGLFALQYITVPDAWHDRLKRDVDFIQKHIFPGSLLLSIGRVNKALHKTGDLFLHGLDDIGDDYARTLHAWRENFHATLEDVRQQKFPEEFIRKWDYYLAYCEAAFDTRNVSVVQAVYTRPNNYSLSSRYR